jgi:hypothetical protein
MIAERNFIPFNKERDNLGRLIKKKNTLSC